eukprot:1068527-Pyramimonas_sp.AAC.1
MCIRDSPTSEGTSGGLAAKKVAERMQTYGTTECLLKSKSSLFKPLTVSHSHCIPGGGRSPYG